MISFNKIKNDIKSIMSKIPEVEYLTTRHETIAYIIRNYILDYDNARTRRSDVLKAISVAQIELIEENPKFYRWILTNYYGLPIHDYVYITNKLANEEEFIRTLTMERLDELVSVLDSSVRDYSPILIHKIIEEMVNRELLDALPLTIANELLLGESSDGIRSIIQRTVENLQEYGYGGPTMNKIDSVDVSSAVVEMFYSILCKSSDNKLPLDNGMISLYMNIQSIFSDLLGRSSYDSEFLESWEMDENVWREVSMLQSEIETQLIDTIIHACILVYDHSISPNKMKSNLMTNSVLEIIDIDQPVIQGVHRILYLVHLWALQYNNII